MKTSHLLNRQDHPIQLPKTTTMKLPLQRHQKIFNGAGE
jgi:hypothetical protein